ncbi:hypothetical protein SAMN05192561_11211 [Halopenitus malekzadehii]|uniref:Uncharacterized protein n=1 Tax=Halopenitus malekzadehii TaxID=1267564 RepID=A0A1H6JF70_9EURY|nr:hypothetical protein [Halopenitus malekzadehii]SEH60529.1 hypothetical protein SAMN05192561_11211 [Halopenitus malekzadehii]
MPELKWTRERTYFDGQRGFRAEGSGVYDVPEDAVEEYLDHRSGGWERVDEEDTADEEVEPETIDEDSGSDDTDSAGDGEAEPPNEGGTEPDADGENEVTPEEIASSDDWRWAVDTIESGTVDDQLDAVEAAEEERENGPRDSVLTALDDRREA